MSYITIPGTPDGNDITRIQAGSNISTGGTENAPSLSLVTDISVRKITASGATSGVFSGSLTALTVSAATIYSASTDLSTIILNAAGSGSGDYTRVQGSNYIFTGGTANAPTINLAQNFSGATISGGTIYSGYTNLENIFEHKVRKNAGINVFSINAGVRFPITGASLSFSAGEIQVGTTWEVFLNISKTAAGTASNTWSMHLGTLGTSADTLVSAFSGITQTAIADNGIIRGTFIVLTGGTSGIIQSSWELQHRANTGFANANGAIVSAVTSNAINLTTPTKFTIHYSGGSSSVLTIKMVTSKMYTV